MESSRRDILNDGAEHRSILKNNQNACCPPLSFTPKTGIIFSKTGVLFLLCNLKKGNYRVIARPRFLQFQEKA